MKKRKKLYISVKQKFIVTIAVVLLWSAFCSVIEVPWWRGLRQALGPVIASMIVFGLAFLPGIMISLTFCGMIFDKPRHKPIIEEELPNITILVAAYNEQESIYETLKSLSMQDYPKKVIVKVIDNNSKDGTKAEVERAIQDFTNINIQYMFERAQGKFHALNTGLRTTKTKYVITIDADTYLYKNALKYLVNSMVQENKNKLVGAIAGAVLVRNSRVNILTKMQEWEYFLSIANIKRCQGLFQSTLVAQGAFSIYDTALLKQIDGWPDSIGEDIVVTWNILQAGYYSYYEERAIAFTNVPTEFKIFARQRSRWARGLLSGLSSFNFIRCRNPYTRVFVFCDLFLFIIDTSMVLFYIPGIIAAIFFHWYVIVGPMTLYLFPATLLLFIVMLVIEYRQVFKPLGLHIRKHYFGLLLYILTYSIILSPICVKGYLQELFKTKRKWK